MEKDSLLICLPDLPKTTTAVSLSEILISVVVSDLAPSLRVISNELNQVGLLENSQLAWRDFDELIWKDQQPENPVVTFEQRIAEAATWAERASSLLNALKMQRSVLLMLQRGMPKPQGNT